MSQALDRTGAKRRLSCPWKNSAGGAWSPSEALVLNTLFEDLDGRYQISGPNAFSRYGWDDQVPNQTFIYNNRLSGSRIIGAVRLMLVKVADDRLGTTEAIKVADGLSLVYASKASHSWMLCMIGHVSTRYREHTIGFGASFARTSSLQVNLSPHLFATAIKLRSAGSDACSKTQKYPRRSCGGWNDLYGRRPVSFLGFQRCPSAARLPTVGRWL